MLLSILFNLHRKFGNECCVNSDPQLPRWFGFGTPGRFFLPFFYFLSCGLFSPLQFRHLLIFFVRRRCFFGYNFLVFFVEARERKVFQFFSPVQSQVGGFISFALVRVLTDVLISGSSVVTFVRPYMWLVFPNIAFAILVRDQSLLPDRSNVAAEEIAKSVTRDNKLQSYAAYGGPSWLSDLILAEAISTINQHPT